MATPYLAEDLEHDRKVARVDGSLPAYDRALDPEKKSAPSLPLL